MCIHGKSLEITQAASIFVCDCLSCIISALHMCMFKCSCSQNIQNNTAGSTNEPCAINDLDHDPTEETDEAHWIGGRIFSSVANHILLPEIQPSSAKPRAQ